MATEHVAYCTRNGRIRVGKRCPQNALPLCRGSEYDLRKLVKMTARRSKVGGYYLVPGVPEAATDNDAVEAVIAYRDGVLGSQRKTSAGVRRALS